MAAIGLYGTLGFKMKANERQIGGSHYKGVTQEHWDRAAELRYDPMQYIITKWVERWRKKGGLQDLYKAKHAIEKYIELVENKVYHESDGYNDLNTGGCEPGREYVNQDR